jgi:hypothetical protein
VNRLRLPVLPPVLSQAAALVPLHSQCSAYSIVQCARERFPRVRVHVLYSPRYPSVSTLLLKQIYKIAEAAVTTKRALFLFRPDRSQVQPYLLYLAPGPVPASAVVQVLLRVLFLVLLLVFFLLQDRVGLPVLSYTSTEADLQDSRGCRDNKESAFFVQAGSRIDPNGADRSQVQPYLL